MPTAIDPKQAAKKNPGVDVKKIEEALGYRKVLEEAGVFKKADYRVSPPLGGVPDKPAPQKLRIVRMTRTSKGTS